MNKDDENKPGEDVLFPAPFRNEDGGVPFVRHTADHEMVQGVMYPCEEGKPLLPGNEIFSLEPRAKGGLSVTSLYSTKASGAQESKGPAKVNSRAYRANWETIFGKKAPIGEA